MDNSIATSWPFALVEIDAVVFYKRHEITSDLICCDVGARGLTWTFHEERPEWRQLIEYLEKLPDFQADWYAAVVSPAFAMCETTAYRKSSV